jgi:hypothetical protein
MYTLELYKTDARTNSGDRLGSSKLPCELHYAKMYPAPKYRIELHETMVTKRNILNGAEFQERYDTPYYCSPSSETYWSM